MLRQLWGPLQYLYIRCHARALVTRMSKIPRLQVGRVGLVGQGNQIQTMGDEATWDPRN